MSWLYHEILRSPERLDATVYARETKILKPLMARKKGIRTYTAREIADCVIALAMAGVEVDSFRILHVPELLMSFADGDMDRFSSIVRSLRKDNGWKAPRGWEEGSVVCAGVP